RILDHQPHLRRASGRGACLRDDRLPLRKRQVHRDHEKMTMEGIRKEISGNGLVLITEPMRTLRSVALGVWMKKGSRHETADQNGISHFIEHLLFKGTETRTAQDIALVIDSVGGQMDAFTTKEHTCFYFKVLDRHLDIAIELLSDIVRHPKFLPEEIEKERK